MTVRRSTNWAKPGSGAYKLEILVTVSNKPPITVELRDINRDAGDETFFEFNLKEEK